MTNQLLLAMSLLRRDFQISCNDQLVAPRNESAYIVGPGPSDESAPSTKPASSTKPAPRDEPAPSDNRGEDVFGRQP